VRKSFALVFILLFSFCSKKENKYPRVIIPNGESAIEVNTETMLHMTNDYYLFVGNFDSDTLFDGRYFKEDEKYQKDVKSDTVLPKYDFKIIIDTSYTITTKGFEYKNVDLTTEGYLDFEKVFSLPKTYVECYPLLIFNTSDKPAYSDSIRMIQQAKDKDGKWKPIEYFFKLPINIIPSHRFFYEHLPKKYCALSVMKYQGDFKTKLRVKVKIGQNTYYSNEIGGYINRTQFNKTIAHQYINAFKPVADEIYIEEYLPYVFLEK
jgi:hypothetical protein